MRFLRFLGRWWAFGIALVMVGFSPDPRVVAGCLLLWVIAGNMYHRYKVKELRRQAQPTPWPVPYPVPWPVPWQQPWYPPAPPPGPVPAPSTREPEPGSADQFPALPPGRGEEPPNRGYGGTKAVAVATVAVIAACALGLSHPAPAEAAVRSAPRAPVAEPAVKVPSPWQFFWQSTFGGALSLGTEGGLRASLGASEASMLTPQFDTQTRVNQIWGFMVVIADSLLLLLIVVGAVMVVAGDWTYLEAKALAPRVVVAGVVLNLSLAVIGQAISWSNDIVKGFLAMASQTVGNSVLPPDLATSFAHQSNAVMLALLLIVVLFLLIANLVRLIVVLVLAIGGPLLHVFGVLPATDSIARIWWRGLAATLIAPAVQALLMLLATWIATTGNSPFASVFNNPSWAAYVNGAMLFVILLLMALSPLWMLKRALGEGHQHLAAAVKLGRRAVMGAVTGGLT